MKFISLTNGNNAKQLIKIKVMKTKLEKYKLVASSVAVDYNRFKNVDNFYKKVDAIIKANNLEFNKLYKDAVAKERKERKERAKIAKKRKELERLGSIITMQLLHDRDIKTNEFLKSANYAHYGLQTFGLRERVGGGHTTIRFVKADIFGIFHEDSLNYNIYARSCSFAAIDRVYKIQIPSRGYICRKGGMLTWIANTNKKGSKARWLVQGKGNLVDVEQGFLVGDYHIEAKTLKEARAKLLAIRLKQRANKANNVSKMISYSDSIKSGNCISGTNNFINRHGLDADKTYSKQYLLSIADNQEKMYINRIKK